MFRFDWAEFAEEPVLEVLAELSGIDDLGSAQPAVARSVAAILSAVGGLPVCERLLDGAERATVAEMLLSEAMDRYFAITGTRRRKTGYLLGSADPGHFDHEILHAPLVDVNSATAQQLIDLPAIGKRLAEAIIDERTRHGAFASWDDLAARVDRVGAGTEAILGTAVTFASPGMGEISVLALDASFAVRFGALLDRFPSGSRTEVLLRALDSLAVAVASDPHPSTVLHQRRLDLEREPLALQEVGWLGVLADRDYYRRLPDLLATANDSISVAMFHIALPEDAHPTRDLLDELVSAHGRGIGVRVLIDSDRPTDPYQSTAINTPAKTYLEDRGVPVRSDDEEILLHSKFVVIDRRLCIIGSHNWSAGSFFHFDDVSMVISSDALGAELGDRFDAMWAG